MQPFHSAINNFSTTAMCALAISASIASFAHGADSTWKGGIGNWSDALWTGGAPQYNSNVFIDGGKTGTASNVLSFGQGPALNNLTVDAGDALTLRGGFTMNGSITVNGNMTLGADAAQPGTLLFNEYATGVHRIDGTGTITIANAVNPPSTTYATKIGNGLNSNSFLNPQLEFGPNLTIRGGNAEISNLYSTNRLKNYGTILAEFGMFAMGNARNESSGRIRASGSVNASLGDLINDGVVEIADNAIVQWAPPTTANFGTVIRRGNGQLVLTGRLDNTGRVWDVDATVGNFRWDYGTITGGRIKALPGTSVNFYQAWLQNVTLDSLSVQATNDLGVINTLTLDRATVTLNSQISMGFSYNEGVPILAGIGTIVMKPFIDGSSRAAPSLSNGGSEDVVIPEGITIKGNGRFLGRNGGGPGAFINRGTVETTNPGDFISLRNFVNEGTLTCKPGTYITITNPSEYHQLSGKTVIDGRLGSGQDYEQALIEGGILAGSGRIATQLSLLSATLEPGSVVGTLTTDFDVFLSLGTHLKIDVLGTSADRLVVGGEFEIGDGVNYLDVNLLLPPLQSTRFEIVSAAGGVFGKFSNVTPGYVVEYDPSGRIYLNVVVPEPSTLAMALCCSGLMLRQSRARPRR